MGKIIRLVFLPMILLAAVGYYVYTDNAVDTSGTQASMQLIKTHMNGQGKIIDLEGAIDVQDAEDIKLFVDDKTITILFGKIQMSWTHAEFLDPVVADNLRLIGLDVRYNNDDGRLRLFYKDVEVKRWVNP